MSEKYIITSITISSADFENGCHYCGGKAECWDHIIPKSLDGDNSIENLIPSCTQCNSSKWNKPLFKWRKEQKELDDKGIGYGRSFDTPNPHPIEGKRYLSSNAGFIKFVSDDREITIDDLWKYINRRTPYQDNREDDWIRAITSIFNKASQNQDA